MTPTSADDAMTDTPSSRRGPLWVFSVRTTDGDNADHAAWASLTLDGPVLEGIRERLESVRRMRADGMGIRTSIFASDDRLSPTFHTKPDDYLTQPHADSFRTVLEQARATGVGAELGRDDVSQHTRGVEEVEVSHLEMVVDPYGVHWRGRSERDMRKIATGRVGSITMALAALWTRPDDELSSPFAELSRRAPKLALAVLEHGLSPVAGCTPERKVAPHLDREDVLDLLTSEDGEVRRRAMAALGEMDEVGAGDPSSRRQRPALRSDSAGRAR